MAETDGQAVAPAATEIEVSLFGPGLGEAIAVHLGCGEWMLVDSCLDSAQDPASLAYLRSIGVAPEKFALIVATHWHDDHVGGLAKVVEECTEAAFVYSGAFRGKEFAALVGALSERAQIRRSGVSEFAAITQILKERKGTERKMAVESRRLWHRDEDLPAAVDSLSPCDEAVLRAHEALASLLPAPETNKRAVVAPQPNHASVVLWVSVGEARVLLGADLEETGNPATGWTAILDRCQLEGSPASVFKVPHHGSQNADQPRVWNEVLNDSPWAVVTPFIRGSQELPTAEDKRRLKGQTSRVFLTSKSERQAREREPAVEAVLDMIDTHPVLIDPPMGQIRLRCGANPGNGWACELIGPAHQLN